MFTTTTTTIPSAAAGPPRPSLPQDIALALSQLDPREPPETRLVLASYLFEASAFAEALRIIEHQDFDHRAPGDLTPPLRLLRHAPALDFYVVVPAETRYPQCECPRYLRGTRLGGCNWFFRADATNKCGKGGNELCIQVSDVLGGCSPNRVVERITQKRFV